VWCKIHIAHKLASYCHPITHDDTAKTTEQVVGKFERPNNFFNEEEERREGEVGEGGEEEGQEGEEQEGGYEEVSCCA
jgi:hypothetical protein